MSITRRMSGASILFVLFSLGCNQGPGPQANTSASSGASKGSVAPLPPADILKYWNMCLACHSVGGKGGPSGGPLDGTGSRRTASWLELQIRRPDLHNKKTAMPPYPKDQLPDEAL